MKLDSLKTKTAPLLPYALCHLLCIHTNTVNRLWMDLVLVRGEKRKLLFFLVKLFFFKCLVNRYWQENLLNVICKIRKRWKICQMSVKDWMLVLFLFITIYSTRHPSLKATLSLNLKNKTGSKSEKNWYWGLILGDGFLVNLSEAIVNLTNGRP